MKLMFILPSTIINGVLIVSAKQKTCTRVLMYIDMRFLLDAS